MLINGNEDCEKCGECGECPNDCECEVDDEEDD